MAVGAPWWAIALLALVWLVALLVAIGWFTTRPRVVVLVPVVVGVVWLVTVVAGARYLDWR